MTPRRLHLQPVPGRRPTSRCCSTPGPRAMFPLVAEAVATVMPVESLRWITFGHVEADECGSMNMWLAAAPEQPGGPRRARLRRVAQRPVRPAAAAARRRRGASTSAASGVRQISHAARAPRLGGPGAVRGDDRHAAVRRPVHARSARGPALTTDDVVEPALAAEAMFHATCLAPAHRRDASAALGDLRADDAGDHARLVVPGRRQAGRCTTWPPPTSAWPSPPDPNPSGLAPSGLSPSGRHRGAARTRCRRAIARTPPGSSAAGRRATARRRGG